MAFIRFFKNLSLFLIILFCADYVIGKLLKHYYFKSLHTANFETRYAIDSTRADVLIFGSSRANHHYDPRLFDKATKLSFYNCGRDGNFIFYHETLLKLISKRYHPKLILLDVVEEELFNTPNAYDKLNIFLPYYQDYPDVRPTVDKKGALEKYKLWSQVYPYNSQLLPILDGNIALRAAAAHTQSLKGYIPLTGHLAEREPETVISTPSFDENKIDAFKEFIKICKAKSISLKIIISPYFRKGVGKSRSVLLMKKIANEYNVDFLDFSSDSHFNNLSFKDPVHLNGDAVPIFDSLLIKNIFRDTAKFQRNVAIKNQN